MEVLQKLFCNKKSFYITIALSLLYILPLLLADVWYQDDLSRAIYGYNWSHDGRFVANWLLKWITFSGTTFSIFPFSLLLSSVILGIAGYILTELFNLESGKLIKWSSLLVLSSPFYLANLPYRYDALAMSVSIFLMIFPFVYFKHNKVIFTILSSLCFFLTLGLFQPSISVYFIVALIFLSNSFENGYYLKFRNELFLICGSFLIGLVFYFILLKTNNDNISDNRMEFIFNDANRIELFKAKFELFFDNFIFLCTTQKYYYFFTAFLLLPFVSIIHYFKESKSVFFLIRVFFVRLVSSCLCFLLIVGPNLFIKADYLPIRAMPAFGVFLFFLVSFSNVFSGFLLFVTRIILFFYSIFCFHLMTQTANALKFQSNYQEMFVYDLNAVIRTYDVKKIMFKGKIQYAKKSELILSHIPFIKTIVMQDIGQDCWFNKEALSFSGIHEFVEFVPLEKTEQAPILISKSYMYNLYKIDEGFFMIEFN